MVGGDVESGVCGAGSVVVEGGGLNEFVWQVSDKEEGI